MKIASLIQIIVLSAAIQLIASPTPVAAAEGNSSNSESWYTVTLLPKTPYAYYRETIEYKNGRIHFKTQMWKKEEGFINEEQLGAYALDNELLTPLFYNFHSTYRSSELTIDGSATENRLTVRIKKTSETGSEKPTITRMMPSKTILSSFFPVLLKKNFRKKAKQGSFLAILEDNESVGFSPVNGSFKMKDPDDFSKSSGATRFEVQFSGNKSYWYLDKDGGTLRIEMPEQGARVDRVSETSAKSFFNKDGK